MMYPLMSSLCSTWFVMTCYGPKSEFAGAPPSWLCRLGQRRETWRVSSGVSMASNMFHWYKFINGVLGREVKNGDIRFA